MRTLIFFGGWILTALSYKSLLTGTTEGGITFLGFILSSSILLNFFLKYYFLSNIISLLFLKGQLQHFLLFKKLFWCHLLFKHFGSCDLDIITNNNIFRAFQVRILLFDGLIILIWLIYLIFLTFITLIYVFILIFTCTPILLRRTITKTKWNTLKARNSSWRDLVTSLKWITIL